MATVIVGESKKKIIVHQALLVHHSSFFRAALTGKFKEAEDKTIKLEEESPIVFEFVVHWLYYKRFPDADKGDDDELLSRWKFDSETTNPGCFVWLYIFGDRYLVDRLKFDALTELESVIRKNYNQGMPGPGHIQLAFDQLPAKSPMCRLLIELFSTGLIRMNFVEQRFMSVCRFSKASGVARSSTLTKI
jgi:hypothetical protein